MRDSPTPLLSAAASREADRLAMTRGISGEQLMENAGKAVAECVMNRFSLRPVLVCCGAGNNGGDGFVVARLLEQSGWPVAVTLLGDTAQITGDAAIALRKWQETGGSVELFSPTLLQHAALVIDALFGTGLSRPVAGSAKTLIEALNACGKPIMAVDMPSGIHADSGEVMGAAITASCTVTFFRAKPGHYLLPGKRHCGEVICKDIGIPPDAVLESDRATWLNTPSLWRNYIPALTETTHKYRRGHALIHGGPMECSGAARLAALAALRSGAGLVSVACIREALLVYAASLTAVMTRPYDSSESYARLIEEPRITALLIGPGAGVNEATARQMEAMLRTHKPIVLDADALTLLGMQRKALFPLLHSQCVLTPHEGEFARIFPNTKGDKLARARAAAKESGAVMVLKGNDTVVAAPDGRAAINANAPAWLATAGSGDVLAGIITGLLAQGMPAFEAACGGVWLHGEAANHAGRGMIAEDLPTLLPHAFRGVE